MPDRLKVAAPDDSSDEEWNGDDDEEEEDGRVYLDASKCGRVRLQKKRNCLVQEITSLAALCIYLETSRKGCRPPARARRPPFPGSPSGERGPQASQELTYLAFKYKATH